MTSMLPREHGAYGQLAFPLLTALGDSRGRGGGEWGVSRRTRVGEVGRIRQPGCAVGGDAPVRGRLRAPRLCGVCASLAGRSSARRGDSRGSSCRAASTKDSASSPIITRAYLRATELDRPAGIWIFGVAAYRNLDLLTSAEEASKLFRCTYGSPGHSHEFGRRHGGRPPFRRFAMSARARVCSAWWLSSSWR
jgi:hypothetical protein